METAIVSIVCVVLIILGGMTMSQGFLASADSTSVALEELGNRGEEMMRTELSPQAAGTDAGGDTLTLTLENSGQTKLADFGKWDLIVQYYDENANYYIRWLPYIVNSPDENEWTVNGIYLDSDPETFEPNILNPGEIIQIEAVLYPPVGTNTTNMVVASTPNGIPAMVMFSR